MRRRAVVGLVAVLLAVVCWSEAQRQYQHVTAAVTVAEVRNLVASFGLAELGAVVILYRLAAYWFMVLIGELGSAYRVVTVGAGSLSTRP